jgi:hypothetical protein
MRDWSAFMGVKILSAQNTHQSFLKTKKYFFSTSQNKMWQSCCKECKVFSKAENFLSHMMVFVFRMKGTFKNTTHAVS